MKVQCSCGAKHAFEITPEMRTNPVRFVCPACGADASEFVDGLIRQELGQNATPGGRVISIQAMTETPVPAPSPGLQTRSDSQQTAAAGSASAPLRVRISAPEFSQPEIEAPEPGGPPRCLKHPGELAEEQCRVCSKPICPKCMELFGYVCSPLCKAKADSHGIQVPIYKGQRSLVQARLWRKTAWVGSTVAILAAGLIGFRVWHWFGSAPKEVYSIRFPEPVYSGQTLLAGEDQIIFLRGGTLSRHDMQQKKEIWSSYVLDKDEIKAEVASELKEAKDLIYKANNKTWENVPKMPDREKLAQSLEREAGAAMQLRIRGQNIWVFSARKLVRYDWNTGKSAQEVPLTSSEGALIARGDELLLMNDESGRPVVTSINLNTCDSRKIPMGRDEDAPKVVAGNKAVTAGGRSARGKNLAGLPTGTPGRDAAKVMDPAKVAAQAQHMSLPARIALPAVLANSWSQERALAELDVAPQAKTQSAAAAEKVAQLTVIPTMQGFLEFSARLLEQKAIMHSTMKAPPAKSVLDGPVNVTQSAEVANEILNEMQRSRGGDVVAEDVSRYSVTLRRVGAPETWTGEVIGVPSVIPLQTVTVLAANKVIIVFDQENKKLWQTTNNYNLSSDLSASDERSATYGQGPCVERLGTLYVFDEGVLSAFDLKSGNARWRVPSVGITGLFFDDQGMMYVNTTTGSPDSIKFSHQININQKTTSVVLKVNPANGKILWTASPGALVNYVSGEFIYTVQSYAPEEEEDNPYRPETGFETLPHMKIKRLNPQNGHEMWEHVQNRAPIDVQFEQNTIRLVFKKEVQVLKCLAW